MSNLLCPYCFERFDPKRIVFRCQNEDPRACALQEDPSLSTYLRLSVAAKRRRIVTPPAKRFGIPDQAVCTCGCVTRTMLCPHCHNELPFGFTSRKSLTVALIGAKEAGKSNYIAVLIQQFRNQIGPAFHAALDASDEATIERYNRDFKRYVYESGTVVPATNSARSYDAGVRTPLIYRLGLDRKRFGVLTQNLALSLVFFDTAGEDLDHYSVMSVETRYLANADGLIFLLDPLQMTSVRDQLRNKQNLPGEHTDPQDIVNRATWLIRQMGHIKENDRISTPVAIAFSKMDAVRSLVDSDSAVYRASAHHGHYDSNDGEQVHESMRAYLSRWAPSFDNTLQHSFSKYRYFGLSSFGYPPSPDGSLPKGISPFRVEDPFLWLMHEFGLIDASKGAAR